MMMFLSAFVSGIASAGFIFKGGRVRIGSLAAAELTVLFGSLVLITGPLWARKAWGVWWQWDARLTSSLLMLDDLRRLSAAAPLRRPGSDKLAAAVALFGMANVPFVYISVNVWRTHAPQDDASCRRCSRACAGRSGSAWRRSRCCIVLLLALRVRLGDPAGGSRTALSGAGRSIGAVVMMTRPA